MILSDKYKETTKEEKEYIKEKVKEVEDSAKQYNTTFEYLIAYYYGLESKTEFERIELNKDIAMNLYTAINTDTGSFKYDNVTPETHRIIASLLPLTLSISATPSCVNESWIK